MATTVFAEIPPEVEQIGRRVIGSAIALHRALGPGYKEPIYVEAFCLELDARALKFARENRVTVTYKNVQVGKHRLDLLVEEVVIVVEVLNNSGIKRVVL